MAFEKVYSSGKISHKHAFLVKEMLRKPQEWIINIALTFLKSQKKWSSLIAISISLIQGMLLST